MKRINPGFIFILILSFACLTAMAQTPTAGDYRTFASGNWSDITKWQVRDGSGNWTTAITVPGSGNNIYVQATHSLTVDVEAYCSDLHLNAGTSPNGGSVIMNGSFNLNVNGKIRAYSSASPEVSGADGSYTGVNSVSPLSTMISTSSTGLLRFVGGTRNITNTGEWNGNGTTNNTEFALNAGATGTLATGMKFRTITFSSGIISASNSFAVGTSSGNGNLTIKSGAKLVSSRGSQVITYNSLSKCGTVTIEAGGILELTNASPTMDATSFVNNGTVIYSGATQTLLLPGADASSTPILNYSSLTISGTGPKTITGTNIINVTGTLTLAGNNSAILTSPSGSIAYSGASSTFALSGTASYAVTAAGLEWPAANGPANVTVNANTLSLTVAASTFSISNLQISSNVATITTSGTHGFAVGQVVTLGNVSPNTSIFNGTYTITAVTSNTFSFSKTNADIASIAATNGTAALNNINRTITGLLTLSGGSFAINGGNVLTMANNSTIVRSSSTGSLSLGATDGWLSVGTGSSDLVNITVNAGASVAATSEFGSSPSPGAYGTLTISSGTTYTATSGRTLVNLNNSGTFSLAPTSTGTLNISGTVTGTGFLRSNGSTSSTGPSIAFTGTGAAGTLYFDQTTPGTTNAFNSLTLNRSSGSLTLGNNVSFGTGGSSYSVTLTAGELQIANNVTLTIANRFSNNSGTGTIGGGANGSATNLPSLVVSGTGTTFNNLKFTSGNSEFSNLSIGRNMTIDATAGNGFRLHGVLNFTSINSTFTTNGNLTIRSTSSGTGRIADITNAGVNTGNVVSGNVTVERYIKLRSPGTGDGTGNNGRAYRLLAPTVNSTGTIRTNWMEGGMNTAVGTNINPVANYGTQITGSGGNTNGFDVTASNAASLYASANAVTPTYTAINSTAGMLNALTGYFVYIRGDRSMNMQVPLGTNMPTSHTTLRTTGTLITGTVNSFTNAYVGDGALNLVTNPYASPIDWALVQSAGTNLGTSYTFWDPNVGTRGGFVSVTTGGVVSGGGTATRFIQPGQAFFVQASGGVPAVSIQETHKAAGNNNTVFLVPPESFQTALYFYEDSGYRRMADGVNVLYDDVYSSSLDGYDATEINNWDENIAIDRHNKHLAIEGRPVIITRDTIALFMNNMKQRAYEFDFVPASFTHIGLKAELIDNFLGTRTLLSVVDTVTVSFNITSDPASYASERFMIVFGPMAPLAIDQLSIKAQVKYQPAAQGGNGVQVDWSAKTEKDMDRYEVERSFDGRSFTKIKTIAAIGNSTVPTNYTWLDAGAQTGDNFYRVRAIDMFELVKYTSIVKVNFGKANPTITVNPNPVRGNSFNLQLTDVAKGSYTLQLYNNLGQVVYRSTIQHAGGSVNIPVSPGKGLVQGVYELVLTGDGNTRIVNRIIKN